MSDAVRNIVLNVRTTRDEGPTRSTERVDELGDHALKSAGKVKVLGKASKSTSKDLLKLAGAATVADKALDDAGKGGMEYQRVMFKVHKTMRTLGGMLQKMLVGAFKLATMAVGGMSVALVGIHALFVAGRFLVKSYHVALKGLAGAAAGATVAMGLLAAAMREQQAAQFAYTSNGNKEFGSGLRQAQVNMRSLHADTQLAGAGAEALNKAYAEIAKSKIGFTGQSKTLLKGLGDFAAAGQPLEEGLSKAAALVNVLQDKKKGFGAITAAAKEMGPAMEKAMEEAKKKGIDTRDEFLKALQDGTLAQLGGVTGQMDAVNNTLVGQLKKYFNLIKVQFADFGQQFLPEAKYGLQRIYEIFTRTMRQTSGAIAGWEKRGGFVNAIVNAAEKMSNFYLKLIREYLPKSEGMFKRLGEWWGKFKQGWNEIADGLRPFIDGARVIESSFGKAWRPIWSEIKNNSQEFNKSVQKNAPAFQEFGETLGTTIGKLLQMLNMFQKVIVNNLPFISKVVRAIGNMVEQFSSIFGFLQKMFGERGATMALFAISRALKTTRGTLVQREVSNMNVSAKNVSIMGGIKGAYEGYKVGKLAGPKGAAAGAIIGGVANSGILGPKAKEWWQKTGGTASRVLSIKSLLGKVGLAKAGASAAAAATGTAAAATPAATAALRSSGTTSTSVQSLGSSSTKATKGLNSFNQALGKASASLRSLRSGGAPGGGGIPAMPLPTPTMPAGPTSPMPGAPGTPAVVPAAGGTPKKKYGPWSGRVKAIATGTKKQFSRVSHGMARVGGYGAMHTAKQDKDNRQGRKPFGGMGSFALSMGLANLSDRVDNPDISAGLGLAATTAMFSPKMGLGLAGGTFALNTEDSGLAMLGGAGAGATIGSEFGAAGAVIGAAIGTIVGAINAPLYAMKQAKKNAKAIIGDFFERTTGEIMVQAALLEGAAMKSGKKETTIVQSMEDASDKFAKIAAIAERGSKAGHNRKTSTLGYAGTVGAGTAAGTIAGSFIPGVGNVMGAAAGFVAANAAYVGERFINYFASRKENNEKRKARGQSINELYRMGLIDDAQYKKLTAKKKNKFMGVDRLAKDASVDDALQQEFLDQFAKESSAYSTAYDGAAKLVNSRAQVISRMTGKTTMEVMELARTMNVNLADSTEDFNKQLIRLGVTVVKTAREIDQAVAQIMTQTIDTAYSTAIKQEQAPHIINDIIKNFATDYRSRTDKTVTAADSQTVIGGVFEQLTNAYGGDTTKAYFETVRQLGSADGLAFLETNPLTGKKNPLGGMGQAFYSGKAGQTNTKVFTDLEQNLADVMMPQLGAVLAQSDLGFGDRAGMDAAKKRFMELSLSEQELFTNVLSTGDYKSAGFADARSFMDAFGMGGENLESISADKAAFAMATDNLEKESILLEAEMKVIEDMGKFFGEDSQKPEWWSKESLIEVFAAAGIGGQDTRTPRGKGIGDTTSSRLQQTMARHGAMNSMISGKRFVTSSYRTTGLGSINSDHVTGRAYDLVGNQLGMYKTIVERNGGFAEFHGGSINRHLHVVPGPGIAPMGDMVTPASKTLAASPRADGSSGRREMTINMNVQGIGINEATAKIKAELERAAYEMNNRK